MKTLSNQLRNRGRSGQQLIEISCGLLFLIPIFLFLFDIAFMYFAANLSDGVARDAARAAAAVAPTFTVTGQQPLVASTPNLNRALAVVNQARARTGAGSYIQRFDIDVAPTRSFFNITGVPDAFRGGQWLGTVTVRTRLTYALPVSIPGITPSPLFNEAQAQFPLTASSLGTVRNFIP